MNTYDVPGTSCVLIHLILTTTLCGHVIILPHVTLQKIEAQVHRRQCSKNTILGNLVSARALYYQMWALISLWTTFSIALM